MTFRIFADNIELNNVLIPAIMQKAGGWGEIIAISSSEVEISFSILKIHFETE